MKKQTYKAFGVLALYLPAVPTIFFSVALVLGSFIKWQSFERVDPNEYRESLFAGHILQKTLENFLTVHCLSVSATTASPHSPWLISLSFPLGAVGFWVMRGRFLKIVDTNTGLIDAVQTSDRVVESQEGDQPLFCGKKKGEGP